jgi:hypothetical protein
MFNVDFSKKQSQKTAATTLLLKGNKTVHEEINHFIAQRKDAVQTVKASIKECVTKESSLFEIY